MTTTPSTIVPPIITLGPWGYLAVEASPEGAVDHMRYDRPEVEDPGATADLRHYDSTGRTLQLEHEGADLRLMPGGHAVPRAALVAQIDAAFSYARARAYEDGSAFDDAHAQVTEAADVRPPQLTAGGAEPSDEAYEEYFGELLNRMETQGAHDTVGSWWHNLFYH